MMKKIKDDGLSMEERLARWRAQRKDGKTSAGKKHELQGSTVSSNPSESGDDSSVHTDYSSHKMDFGHGNRQKSDKKEQNVEPYVDKEVKQQQQQMGKVKVKKHRPMSQRGLSLWRKENVPSNGQTVPVKSMKKVLMVTEETQTSPMGKSLGERVPSLIDLPLLLETKESQTDGVSMDSKDVQVAMEPVKIEIVANKKDTTNEPEKKLESNEIAIQTDVSFIPEQQEHIDSLTFANEILLQQIEQLRFQHRHAQIKLAEEEKKFASEVTQLQQTLQIGMAKSVETIKSLRSELHAAKAEIAILKGEQHVKENSNR